MLAKRKRVSRSPYQSRKPETAKRTANAPVSQKVELLPGVELPLRNALGEQPAAVVAVEQVEFAQACAQAAAVAERDDRGERDEPGDRAVEVDFLDERAAPNKGDQLR